MTRTSVILSLAVLASAASAKAQTTEPVRELAAFAPDAEKFAVLVSVGKYQHRSQRHLADLEGPESDQDALAAALIQHHGFNGAAVLRLHGPAATRDGLLRALAELTVRAAPGRVLVFAFGGHGATVEDQRPFDEADGQDETLCPYDADLGMDVLDDELHTAFARILAKGAHLITIFDSCHSGTVNRADGVSRKAEPLKTAPLAAGDALVGDEDKLVGALASHERLVSLAAASDHELAIEAGAPRRGVFTSALISLLTDAGGRTDLCWDYLEPALRAKVELVSTQTPQLTGNLRRRLFSTEVVPFSPHFGVRAVDGPLIKLDAGEVAGLRSDSIVSVHTGVPVTATAAFGAYRVERVSPFEATARRIDPDLVTGDPLQFRRRDDASYETTFLGQPFALTYELLRRRAGLDAETIPPATITVMSSFARTPEGRYVETFSRREFADLSSLEREVPVTRPIPVRPGCVALEQVPGSAFHPHHVWLDPALPAAVVASVRRELALLRPEGVLRETAVRTTNARDFVLTIGASDGTPVLRLEGRPAPWTRPLPTDDAGSMEAGRAVADSLWLRARWLRFAAVRSPQGAGQGIHVRLARGKIEPAAGGRPARFARESANPEHHFDPDLQRRLDGFGFHVGDAIRCTVENKTRRAVFATVIYLSNDGRIFFWGKHEYTHRIDPQRSIELVDWIVVTPPIGHDLIKVFITTHEFDATPFVQPGATRGALPWWSEALLEGSDARTRGSLDLRDGHWAVVNIPTIIHPAP